MYVGRILNEASVQALIVGEDVPVTVVVDLPQQQVRSGSWNVPNLSWAFVRVPIRVLYGQAEQQRKLISNIQIERTKDEPLV